MFGQEAADFLQRPAFDRGESAAKAGVHLVSGVYFRADRRRRSGTFAAGDVLYLKWFPVGNANHSGVTTTGMNNDSRVQFANGVVISDVTSPDSNASGNVYAEDFECWNNIEFST